jgi:hypothetical protein
MCSLRAGLNKWVHNDLPKSMEHGQHISMRQALAQLRGSGLRWQYSGNGGSSRGMSDERYKCAGCGGRESQ